MQAEADALVVKLSHLAVHGVGHVDVTVAYQDRTVDSARLGVESVPENLVPGDQVVVSKVMNMIVGIRRRDPSDD